MERQYLFITPPDDGEGSDATLFVGDVSTIMRDLQDAAYGPVPTIMVARGEELVKVELQVSDRWTEDEDWMLTRYEVCVVDSGDVLEGFTLRIDGRA